MVEEIRAQSRRVERLRSGFDILDRVIGGIPSGSVILVSGRPGSGSEIFAQQILYKSTSLGLCKALYVTTDRSPDDIVVEMFERGWDINTLLSNKSWEFIDAYSLKMDVERGALGYKALLDLLRKIPSLIKVGVWSAVDTFSSLIEVFGFGDAKALVDELVYAVRGSGGLHLLLLVEGLHDDKVTTALAHMVDGFFRFTLDEQAAERSGVMNILKLRRADYVRQLIPYRIVEGGLVIETATRVR